MNVLVKPGVQFERITPRGFRLLMAIQNAADVVGRDLTITCGTEAHGPTDPHTRGEAYDVRAKDLPWLDLAVLLTWLRLELGSAFTVLCEAPVAGSLVDYVNPRASALHVHVQPKR